MFRLLLLAFALAIVRAADRKNVLFIVADDLRAEHASFLPPDTYSNNSPRIHSPNLDRLASKSLLMKRTYVQQAICSPSRASFMTGRRPDTTHVYDLFTYFREAGGNFTTIPQYFKENGYKSIGMGKIFHPGAASNNNDPLSWSVPYYTPSNKGYWSSLQRSWVAVTEEERAETPLPDEQLADYAIEKLREVAPDAKAGVRPFFLALGFYKPHLPFTFPEEFLSLYPDVRLPSNPYAPVNMPSVAWSNYGELRSYDDIDSLNPSGAINTTLPADVVLDLRRAFFSSVSYMDSLVGRVVDELESLGLANDTIVSFIGDHGFQLGEHGEWCKHTNFELATQTPMMVHVPGLTDDGIVSNQLTELVDVYPTLVEAAGLPLMTRCPEDSSKIAVCSEGSSLVPLMINQDGPWKSRVFSQYPRARNQGTVMGYSMRTNDYRYTEWAWFEEDPVWRPDWEDLYGVELYDHMSDPDENYNRAYDPAYSNIRSQLSQELHAGWRAAIPV